MAASGCQACWLWGLGYKLSLCRVNGLCTKSSKRCWRAGVLGVLVCCCGFARAGDAFGVDGPLNDASLPLMMSNSGPDSIQLDRRDEKMVVDKKEGKRQALLDASAERLRPADCEHT